MNSAEELLGLLETSEIRGEGAQRLQAYLALLEKWNSRINLASSTDWRIVGPMFEEGVWASKLYPAGARFHLDIGSGAGFPAVLLKVLLPWIRLDLVESRERKSRFLETAAYTLGLTGVRVHNAPLSDYLRNCGPGEAWDCISWKAVKLKTADLPLLRAHSTQDTQLWMFHGRTPALEEGQALDRDFRLLRREKVPGMKESNLSIYHPA